MTPVDEMLNWAHLAATPFEKKLAGYIIELAESRRKLLRELAFHVNAARGDPLEDQ